jgi:hypothetical protein
MGLNGHYKSDMSHKIRSTGKEKKKRGTTEKVKFVSGNYHAPNLVN